MPTTANGTVYRSETRTPGNARTPITDNIRFHAPTAYDTMTPPNSCRGVRLAMFFHGIAGDENTLSGLPTILECLIDAGFVVVEARQCKDPSPSQNYQPGSHDTCAYDNYRQAYLDMADRYCLRDETHIIANSWGGINGLYAATQDPVISPTVQSVTLLRAATNLNGLFADQPFTQPIIQQMFGVPLSPTIDQYRPELWPTSDYQNVPCWNVYYSETDEIVDSTIHVDPLVPRLPAGTFIQEIPGLTHGDPGWLEVNPCPQIARCSAEATQPLGCVPCAKSSVALP